MKRHILIAGAAVLVLGFSASMVNAAAIACPVSYQHPSKASSFKASLVQAFVRCNVPNATTETGTVPTCFPAKTANEQAVSPPGGWLWGPKSQGSISFKPGTNKIVGILNPG